MTNLDGHAIVEIERLTREAETIVTVREEETGVYFVREPDGSHTRQRARHNPKDVTLYDLESLAREIKSKPHLQTVYVSDTEVVALFDDGFVRWRAKVALPQHPSFVLASRFKVSVPLTQKELVRLLRTELSSAVSITTIDTFASLRFTSNSDTQAVTRPMSAGLDRSIQQAVQARDGQNAPETIELSVPVFDIPETRSDRYPVKVFVDYDHEKSVFLLVANHDDLRTAQESAVRKVITDLEADARVATTVAYGTPS